MAPIIGVDNSRSSTTPLALSQPNSLLPPSRKGEKNDNNDAEAICEAVNRANIHFLPVKPPDQQAVLTLHRIRKGLIGERTATINQIRRSLAEIGSFIAKGRYQAQGLAEYDINFVIAVTFTRIQVIRIYMGAPLLSQLEFNAIPRLVALSDRGWPQ